MQKDDKSRIWRKRAGAKEKDTKKDSQKTETINNTESYSLNIKESFDFRYNDDTTKTTIGSIINGMDTEFVMKLHIEHYLTEKDINKILENVLDDRVLYKFGVSKPNIGRLGADHRSFIINKTRFINIFGETDMLPNENDVVLKDEVTNEEILVKVLPNVDSYKISIRYCFQKMYLKKPHRW